MAQALLQRRDARTEAMRDTIADLLGFDGPRGQLAGLLSGLDVATTSARGTRCSDAACRTSTSSRAEARVGSSSCSTTPGRCCSTSARPAASTSRHGRTGSSTSTPTHTGAWELPVIGAVAAPVAVLVRPDGHVAWVGDGTQAGLGEALTTWFGQPAQKDVA